MKMISSCNGCRVLRIGCKAKCVIRPCLGWMGSAQSRAVLHGISVANVHSHLAPFLTAAPLLQQDYVRRTTTRAPEPKVSTARARLKRPAAEAVPEAERCKRPFWGKNVVGQGEASMSGTKGAKEDVEVELDLNLSLKPPSSS